MIENQNTTVALEEAAVQELVSRIRGALLRPGDAGYEQALRVYNGMIEKRPALIAHCVDVADVMAAVNFAREHELTLAVRGGGHSGPGLGTCDDGLVIDLSGMKGMRVDPSALIEPDYLTRRRALIDLLRAQPSIAPGSFTGDTIYLCAADGDGNAVSLIQSNYMGFGSGVVVDGTGIVLQNRGAYFSLEPTSPNALAPAKRTLHTLIPSMALRDGRPAMVFGTMGGDGQPQIHLQVYTAAARFGLNIQAAIEMPRWIHGAANDTKSLHVESRFPPETLQALRQRGHMVEELSAWETGMGYAQGITFDPSAGVMQGGADPRAESLAATW